MRLWRSCSLSRTRAFRSRVGSVVYDGEGGEVQEQPRRMDSQTCDRDPDSSSGAHGGTTGTVHGSLFSLSSLLLHTRHDFGRGRQRFCAKSSSAALCVITNTSYQYFYQQHAPEYGRSDCSQGAALLASTPTGQMHVLTDILALVSNGR